MPRVKVRSPLNFHLPSGNDNSSRTFPSPWQSLRLFWGEGSAGLKMQEKNEIKLKQKGEVVIMDILGDITSSSEILLRESYRNAADLNARKIILKFERDAYINSGGIALLIQMMYQIRENKQSAAITGISKHFKKIFNMVGITKFAKIFDTVDDALEGLDD